MIEENFEIKMEEGSKPLEEGMYQVELFDVMTEKRATYDTRNKPENEQIMENTFKFHFVILDKDNRLRGVYRNFVPAYFYIGKNGKNALIQIVEAFLKRELTQDELYSFEAQKLNKLVGHQVVVGIKNKQVGEKTYSNIEQFYKAKSQMANLTAEEKAEIIEAKNKYEQEKKNKAFDEMTQTTEEEQHIETGELPTIDYGEEEQINVQDIPF